MSYIEYIPKNFTAAHQEIIDDADAILRDYSGQGFKLSLRQLYYQFVSKNKIENTERSYKRLGNIITDARLAGLISWSHIEDRGRVANVPFISDDEASILKGLEYHLSLDKWRGQECYVEVWVEKDALSNVIERPCNRWKVPYMACKGYMSASAIYRAGKRFERQREYEGKRGVLIHLGDHDPSGMDMTRDNGDRLELFSSGDIEVRRIALNMDQIDEHRPPPNPAKVTDSRSMEYISQFGATSWELDALTPSIIDTLIDDEIRYLVDIDLWQSIVDEQSQRRELLEKIGDHHQAVLDFVSEL